MPLGKPKVSQSNPVRLFSTDSYVALVRICAGAPSNYRPYRDPDLSL